MIDIHTHVSPRDFPGVPAALGTSCCERWPVMSEGDAEGRWNLYFGQRLFRTLHETSWSAEPRRAAMDAEGVRLQILSPMPELLSYWLPAAGAIPILDAVNELISDMVRSDPARFAGLGGVPMQDPSIAAKAISDLKSRHGLHGVEIGSNVNGAYLGDARFAEVWAAAEEADVCVLIHGLHPVGFPATGDRALRAYAGIPSDVAATAASLLVSGVLEKFPRLRIALSHGGGGLPALLGRLDHGWTSTDGFAGRAARRPSQTARRFFIDSNIYDARFLRVLCGIFPGHVCIGTDYPYALAQRDILQYLAAAKLDTAVLDSVLEGAARDFLDL